MSDKPIIPRALAQRDVEEAVDYLLNEAGDNTASSFVDALERAYRHIARHPASGSTRYAHELNLPGLRSWPLRGFAYLLFFVERVDHVDVWRVLHGERHIPTSLRDPDAMVE